MKISKGNKQDKGGIMKRSTFTFVLSITLGMGLLTAGMNAKRVTVVQGKDMPANRNVPAKPAKIKPVSKAVVAEKKTTPNPTASASTVALNAINIRCIAGCVIRMSPDVKSAKVGTAKKNEIYNVTDVYAYSIKIQTDKITGWVYAELLNKSDVWVYAQPDTKAKDKRIGSLLKKYGKDVKVIDKSVKWYRIKEGWVSAGYFERLPVGI